MSLSNVEVARLLRVAAKSHDNWRLHILQLMSDSIPAQHLKQCQDAVKSVNGFQHLFSGGTLKQQILNPKKVLIDTAQKLEEMA